MARPEVGESRVGLLGLSMGGLLAPRAAAFEHRLAACVAVDGIHELGATVLSHFPGSRAEVEAALRAERAPEIGAAMENLMANDPTVRWCPFTGLGGLTVGGHWL
jgi:dienelactone hydrolase